MNEDKLDIVGYWTEIKLSILQDYSKAYARILSQQTAIRHYAYIDGLNPCWKVVEQAERMNSIEIFLNFSIMDANMNVLRGNPESVRGHSHGA